MNNLIPLTEVFLKSSEYDSEEKTVMKYYSLRKIYINASQISLLREDEGLALLAHQGNLIDGIDKRARFSKVFLSMGNTGTTAFSVIGEPEQIFKKMRSK